MKLSALIPVLFLSCLRSFGQDVFECARTGNKTRIEQLEKLSPDTIDAINEAGFTPIILAVYRGHEDLVRYLTEKKVDLDYISPEGTALMAACYKNQTNIAAYLLASGAGPNIRTPEGSSALLYAVLSGNTGLVKLLIEKGAHKTTKDGNGKSVLEYARQRNFPEIVLLLENH